MQFAASFDRIVTHNNSKRGGAQNIRPNKVATQQVSNC